MYLYTSNKREKANNPLYPNRVEVNDLDDLLRVAKYDHIAPAMKDNHRKEDNFLSANCCTLDLDNTHSQDPDEWKTRDDVADAFPDVRFMYVKSRNYMKQKSKTAKNGTVTYYEPREKFHFYAPVSKEITDREECKALMLKVAALFPYFDLGACKPEQFFFGVASPEGGTIEGSLMIDQYIEMVEKENPDAFIESVEEFAEKFHLTDEAKKAVVTIKNYLGIDSDNDDQLDINDLVLDEIPDGAEWLANADQEKSLGWLKDWAGRHNVRLGTRYRFNTKKHPNAIAICTDCPWEDDHSMNGAKNEAVILIEQDGRLGFLCRHSTHLWKYGWKDFRAYHEKKHPDQTQTDSETPNQKKDAHGKSGRFTRDQILSAAKKLSEVPKEPIEWLLPNLIPKEEITIFGGEGGSGKGFTVSGILAGMTHGRMPEFMHSDIPWKSKPATILYLTTEDGGSKVLRPRLEAAGADMDRIIFIDKSDEVLQAITFSDEEGILKVLIEEFQPDLVCFDPIQGFIPDGVNMGARNQMRNCINHLSVLSAINGASFLLFTHFNKRETTDVRMRLADSADIWDISRSVLVTGNTGEGSVKFLSQEKSNYSEMNFPTILYRIEGDPPKVVYAGQTNKRFEDYAVAKIKAKNAAASGGRKASEVASEFIVQTLTVAKNNTLPVKELDELCSACDISTNARRAAKADLRKSGTIKTYKDGFQGDTYIKLVPGEDLDINDLELESGEGK